MANDKNQDALNDQLKKVHSEANEIFSKIGTELEKQTKSGVLELDVLKITKAAGLDIDLAGLAELKIDRIILCPPFIPWYIWFPWRPLWCWWWNRYYPWYRCCPYWWYRCHWYGH